MPHGTWVNAESCDRRVLRDMLGSFMTGVTVVAARNEDGAPSALTANSFTSVSLDPPLILVCLAKSSRSAGVFSRAERFSVNILGGWQRDLSAAFASRSHAKDVALEALTPGSPPTVDGSLATIACTQHQVVDAGDHIILIGGVTEFTSKAGEPLGYFRGAYFGFDPATSGDRAAASPGWEAAAQTSAASTAAASD